MAARLLACASPTGASIEFLTAKVCVLFHLADVVGSLVDAPPVQRLRPLLGYWLPFLCVFCSAARGDWAHLRRLWAALERLLGLL